MREPVGTRAPKRRSKLWRFLKWSALAILALAFLTGGFAWHEWSADKPFYFNNLLNREVLKFALDNPEMLTSLGFLEPLGMRGHNAELDDASPQATEEMFARMHEIRRLIEQYDSGGLDEGEAFSKDVVLYLLELMSDAERFRHHLYPVTQLFGIHSDFPSFMDGMHKVEDLQGAEDYVARLSKAGTKFDQAMEGLRIRETKGLLPPRFVVDRVLTEMRVFVADPVEKNALYESLRRRLFDLKSVSDGDKNRLLAEAAREIEQTVYPAYQKLISYFESLRYMTGDDHGVWRLPDGDAFYAFALEFSTTSDETPESLHRTGLQEVDRIQAEMLEILKDAGYEVSGGFESAMTDLAKNPELYYPDTEAGRKQILADYQKIIDEINEGLDDVFRMRPEKGVEVVRVPKFKEETSPGAYYQAASLDGSRPGRFFANLHDIKATPTYSMRTLAYHEAIPGHHFQIAIAMELDVPLIRRFAPFVAYVEGWALYTEQLAWEIGFQNEPLDNLGRLQAELMRAVRLVVDTGIHAKRWTREEAIEYMRSNTGLAESDVVIEVERYIVMPGQATAYKVGMMKILELRESAKARLGDRFDIRDFHDVVLENGAVPLGLLERLVNQYVEETLANAS